MLFRKKRKFSTERRLEEYWNDERAEIRYRLVEYHFWDGELCECGADVIAEGDKEWERKTSQHYGMSVTAPVWED